MIILNLLLLPSSDTRSLTELITAILQRVGDDIDRNHLPQILVSFVIQIAYNVLFFFFPDLFRKNIKVLSDVLLCMLVCNNIL